MEPGTRELLWQIYCQLSQEQRHFNGIQEKYRLMASSWVVATIAVVGFALTQKEIGDHGALIVGAIGVVSFAGIAVLWSVDIRFYQQLIGAAYDEAMAMEAAHPWLPQVRQNMRARLRGAGPAMVSRFYCLGLILTALLSAAGLCWYVLGQASFSATDLGLCAGIVIVWSLVAYRVAALNYPSATSNVEQGILRIEQRKAVYENFVRYIE